MANPDELHTKETPADTLARERHEAATDAVRALLRIREVSVEALVSLSRIKSYPHPHDIKWHSQLRRSLDEMRNALHDVGMCADYLERSES